MSFLSDSHIYTIHVQCSGDHFGQKSCFHFDASGPKIVKLCAISSSINIHGATGSKEKRNIGQIERTYMTTIQSQTARDNTLVRIKSIKY